MSYMKRAMEEIQERGWPVNDESLKRLEETILKQHGKSFHDWIDNKTTDFKCEKDAARGKTKK